MIQDNEAARTFNHRLTFKKKSLNAMFLIILHMKFFLQSSVSELGTTPGGKFLEIRRVPKTGPIGLACHASLQPLS